MTSSSSSSSSVSSPRVISAASVAAKPDVLPFTLEGGMAFVQLGQIDLARITMRLKDRVESGFGVSQHGSVPILFDTRAKLEGLPKESDLKRFVLLMPNVSATQPSTGSRFKTTLQSCIDFSSMSDTCQTNLAKLNQRLCDLQTQELHLTDKQVKPSFYGTPKAPKVLFATVTYLLKDTAMSLASMDGEIAQIQAKTELTTSYINSATKQKEKDPWKFWRRVSSIQGMAIVAFTDVFLGKPSVTVRMRLRSFIITNFKTRDEVTTTEMSFVSDELDEDLSAKYAQMMAIPTPMETVAEGLATVMKAKERAARKPKEKEEDVTPPEDEVDGDIVLIELAQAKTKAFAKGKKQASHEPVPLAKAIKKAAKAESKVLSSKITPAQAKAPKKVVDEEEEEDEEDE